MKSWQDKKVVVVGAARQGLAATRFLADRGAKVTLTDIQPERSFSEISNQLEKRNVKCVFGGHPLELLRDAEALCLSGGVPLTIPIVKEARKSGILITNDSEMFMESVQANVIGITGSAGKTTTTLLAGAMLKTAMEPELHVWVGGNIGFPMIDHINEIKPEDWVILELSSFQLDHMTISPHIAVILNITPNHLDRHKSMKAYTQAKARIIRFQNSEDIAILNRDDQGSFNLNNQVPGELVTFGMTEPDFKHRAIFFKDDFICWSDGKSRHKLFAQGQLKLPGKHNLYNAMAACAIGATLDIKPENMRQGISSIDSIPNRLELIKEKNGIRWINDSIATAPERVIAAIQAIDAPLVLLLGGRDKDLPWQNLASLLDKVQPRVILFGEAAGLIQKALNEYQGSKPSYALSRTDTLEEAVFIAAKVAQEGDTVLLSPGGTSFDAYRDFEERGDHFRELVERII